MAAIVFRASTLQRISPVAGSVQHCSFSTSPTNNENRLNLASMKRGTGGRSSFNGLVCTVFGSSGFLGRYVCNKLGKIGTQLILPYRGDSYDMLRLKLVGDLGQILFQPYYLKDEDSIYKCVKYSNVVINLVGSDWETKNFKFDDVHVKGARSLAKIAKKAGVDTFIHVSALNAAENPEKFFIEGGSKFLKSKWEGENAVREEFPEAIIFRPSDIYGQEDRFLNYYNNNWRHQLKWLPIYKSGEATEKQPVFVSDVAAGIVAACKDRSARGNIYQAVGPKRYLLSEIVDWFHRLTRKSDDWGYRRYDMRFDPTFQLKVSIMPYMSLGRPIGNIHWERIERECVSDQVERDVCTLEDLGICLTQMEDQVPWEIRPYIKSLYYDEELREFEQPAPPQAIPV